MQAVQCPFRAGLSGTHAVFHEEQRENSHAFSELVSTGLDLHLMKDPFLTLLLLWHAGDQHTGDLQTDGELCQNHGGAGSGFCHRNAGLCVTATVQH